MTMKVQDKVRDLLLDFDVAMLVTHTREGRLRSCPMVLAGVEPEGVLWFITERDSAKVEELERDDQVNVAMQTASKFVSLSGSATAVEDRQKIEELWKEGWKVWFPGGKDDPDLLLLKVTGETGEYWDNSGLNAFKYLLKAGEAYLSGMRPEVNDPDAHGKVSYPALS